MAKNLARQIATFGNRVGDRSGSLCTSAWGGRTAAVPCRRRRRRRTTDWPAPTSSPARQPVMTSQTNGRPWGGVVGRHEGALTSPPSSWGRKPCAVGSFVAIHSLQPEGECGPVSSLWRDVCGQCVESTAVQPELTALRYPDRDSQMFLFAMELRFVRPMAIAHSWPFGQPLWPFAYALQNKDWRNEENEKKKENWNSNPRLARGAGGTHVDTPSVFFLQTA